MRHARALPRMVAELAGWLVLAGVFLWLYVHVLGVSASAIAPHLRLVATTWLVLAAVRMFALTVPARRARFWVSAFSYAALVTTLLAYYVMVVVGLNSWGRVISWDLMRTYALQLPALADALGYSMSTILAVVIAAFAVVLALVALYLRRFDWVLAFKQSVPAGLVALACGASLAIAGIEVYAFTVAPWTYELEPVSLTFYPEQNSHKMEGQLVNRMQAEKLGRAEDAARKAYAVAPAVQKRNVVLVVVDALRPDHLGVLGYARDTTPNLSRIARQVSHATLATVHSACAESACGLLSLASSRYVHQFPDRPITLSETLQRYGYRTHFILSGDHTHFYGLREAYGRTDSYFDGSMADGRYMNDDRLVIENMGRLPAWDGAPTMFQFHLMSAHPLGRREPEFDIYRPATNYAVVTNQERTSGGASARAVNFYDNGVRQADDVIARILSLLKERGYLDNAVVVITADHGELLGEHGMYSHAKSVYEEVLRVPFIMLPFGYSPRRIVEPTSAGEQVDIASTVLAELDIPQPSTWSGRPLQEGRGEDIGYFQQAPFAGVYDWRSGPLNWKYWIDMRSGQEAVLALNRGGTGAAVEAIPPKDRLREWRALVLPTMPGGVRQH